MQSEGISTQAGEQSPSTGAPLSRAGMAVALVVAAVLGFLGHLWVRDAELIGFTTQVSEAVPPIPAVVGLLFLVGVNPLIRRLWARLGLSQGQLLVAYAFLTVCVPMSSVGVVRLLGPSLTVPRYFASAENEYGKIASYMKPWYAPRDQELIRTLYEGADNERVPWGQWASYLTLWGIFFLAVYLATMAALCVLRRQWVDRERLTFPLVEFPVQMTVEAGGVGGSRTRAGAFFRNPIMWTGFIAAVVFDGLNIAKALNPSVPALGRGVQIGALFTERPWNALLPVTIVFRPEILGFAFLVPLDISFSVWFFYMLLRFEAVGAVAWGYEIPFFPFDQEQGTGVYLALAVSVLYVSRQHLLAVFRKVLGGKGELADTDEPLRYRTAVLLGVGAVGVMLAFAIAAGMSPGLALAYFGIVMAVAVGYAKVRAEGGAPMIWLFPFWQQERFITNLAGYKALARGGNYRSLTVLSSMMLLARGYFPEFSAYQVESLKIADEGGIARRRMLWVMVAAMVYGLLCAYWIHFVGYYKYGANVLEEGTTAGGFRVLLLRQEYDRLSNAIRTPPGPDKLRSMASLGGFLLTMVLLLGRKLFLRSPFHPLGFAMSCSYGDPIWSSFFAAWLAKLVAQRLGGMRLYRALTPGFLGLVLGHFFASGAWGLASIFYPDVGQMWIIHFG